jgi:hypothetical protein
MPSPNLPNTEGILNAIVALAQTVTFALTGGATSFKLVTPGGLKDFTDLIPCLTVESLKDSSGPGSSGGSQVGWRVEEPLIFRLSLYVDYTVAANGERDVIRARDAVIPLFKQCIKLGNIALGGSLAAPQNVMESAIAPNSGQYFYREMAGGVVYRGYLFNLQVKQQYSVTVATG